MFIRFFRSSFIIQYIALIIIGTALWIPAFISPSPLLAEQNPLTPFYNLMTGILPDIAWLPPLIALLLVFAEALILNSIVIFHDIAPKNSLLPSFLFTLFMSSGANFLTIYPAILAILPMIFFLHLVYQLHEQSEDLNKVLATGLLIGLCSMIYAPILILILFLWIAFLVYRMLHWREWLVALIGFLLPYLYLTVYYFWMDRLPEISSHYLEYFLNVFHFRITAEPLQLSVWGVFALLMLIPAITRILSTLSSHNISFRRKMSATIWMAAFGAFMIIIPGETGFNTLIYLPAAGILASYFSARKSSVWNELVLLAYLLLIGVNNYMAL